MHFAHTAQFLDENVKFAVYIHVCVFFQRALSLHCVVLYMIVGILCSRHYTAQYIEYVQSAQSFKGILKNMQNDEKKWRQESSCKWIWSNST